MVARQPARRQIIHRGNDRVCPPLLLITLQETMTVLRSRKRRNDHDARLPFAGTPTEAAEASIFLIMRRLDRHLLLAPSRRPFRFRFVVFGRGLRLVFDLFPRHHGRCIMCVDGHCGARIGAWDKRHARAFFLEIVAYDDARLLIAPKPLVGRQVENCRDRPRDT